MARTSVDARAITFPGGKRVDAQVGPYLIQTDQPKDEGGDGTAPEPFMLFLASIGTCAGIYVLGFCQSRGIADVTLMDGLAVGIGQAFSPDRVPARRCLPELRSSEH